MVWPPKVPRGPKLSPDPLRLPTTAVLESRAATIVDDGGKFLAAQFFSWSVLLGSSETSQWLRVYNGRCRGHLLYGRGSWGMFISIKYGENRQFLANINCSVLLLMHYLRDKVGLQRTDPIDLCEENGTLKLLFLVKFPEDSASKFLTPRGTYYICKVERGAPGTKHENGYRAFLPIYKHPPSDLLDSLRNQCDFLEKSRLRMLRSQDGRKPPTMESLLSCMANQVVGKSSGKPGVSLSSGLDEEGTPRKSTTTTKARAEASRKEKHR